MTDSHSEKLRKYSNAVSCAKTGVKTVCRNGSHASVAKHLAARQAINHGNQSTCTQPGAHRKTGKYKELLAQLETHTSLLYISKMLSFFSFVRKGKWANRCDFKILTETTSTSDRITAGSTQLGAAQSDIP
jgi:hypothetical protein